MPVNSYRYFQKARQVASISDYKKQHVGCVAVYQGQIIGIGCNCNKTHPTQKYYNKYRDIYSSNIEAMPKLHAEISCINSIRHLDINFSKVKLYIYRIRNDQPFGMSRPCPSCMAAIKDIGIKNIYYTTNDGYAYEELIYTERIDK
jgi:deoxycytidylate deaminase